MRVQSRAGDRATLRWLPLGSTVLGSTGGLVAAGVRHFACGSAECAVVAAARLGAATRVVRAVLPLRRRGQTVPAPHPASSNLPGSPPSSMLRRQARDTESWPARRCLPARPLLAVQMRNAGAYRPSRARSVAVFVRRTGYILAFARFVSGGCAPACAGRNRNRVLRLSVYCVNVSAVCLYCM